MRNHLNTNMNLATIYFHIFLWPFVLQASAKGKKKYTVIYRYKKKIIAVFFLSPPVPWSRLSPLLKWSVVSVIWLAQLEWLPPVRHQYISDVGVMSGAVMSAEQGPAKPETAARIKMAAATCSAPGPLWYLHCRYGFVPQHMHTYTHRFIMSLILPIPTYTYSCSSHFI